MTTNPSESPVAQGMRQVSENPTNGFSKNNLTNRFQIIFFASGGQRPHFREDKLEKLVK